MKRISKVLTVVMLIALSLFVSCDNGMQVSDGTASVRFASGTEDGNARGLSRVNPVFKADDLYWMYTAKKVDNSGLSTGEVSTPTKVGADGKLTSSVGPFSLGDWEFTLYAYTDSAFENLAYKGSTTARLVKSDSGNSVSVTVSAMKTSEGKGYIAFPAKGGISLTDSNGNPVTSYKELITITDIENPESTNTYTDSTDRTFEVASGAYKVTVAYCDIDDNTLKYGENSIYVNVWDNLTTTIGGSLDEITSDTTFKPSDGTVEANVTATISAGSETEITVASSPANLDSTDSTEKTTVEIPAGATESGSATLTVKSYTVEKVGDFIIEADEGRTVVGGLDLKLEVEGQTIDTFSSAVTVTTYIAKGLDKEELEIKYNGTGDDPTLESYDSTSGKLVFTTTHFSEFYVSTSYSAYIVETNTAYKKMSSAVENVETDNVLRTIRLLRDTTEPGFIVLSGKNIVVDLDGHTYDIDGTVGSSGTETNGFQLLRDSTVYFKNGNVNLENGKILFQNYSNLTIENINASNTYGYVISNNNGSLTLKGNTNITAPSGKVAFDVYYWPKNSYVDGVTVTIDETFTGTIDGKIEYASDGTRDDYAEKAKLYIKSGNFKNFSIETKLLNPSIFISGGTFDSKPAMEYMVDNHYAQEVNGKFEIREVGFSGGNGTENNPFVISNEDDFANIYILGDMMAKKDGYFYFTVENDLDFSGFDRSPAVPIFRGEIDFNDHVLSGITNELLNDKANDEQKRMMKEYPQDSSLYSIFQLFMNGKISNLDYEASEYVSLSTWLAWGASSHELADAEDREITFENVEIWGDIKFDSSVTNFSLFGSQVFNNTTLTFNNCANHADYLAINGLSYGSVFLGGYAVNSTVYFTNCTNDGTITSIGAGMLVGNANQSNTSRFIVENCTNNGSVIGIDYSDLLCGYGAYENYEGTVGGNSAQKLEVGDGIAWSVGDDNSVQLTIDDTRIAKYNVEGYVYSSMLSSSDSYMGTMLVSVSSGIKEYSAPDTGFAKLQMIDSRKLSGEQPYEDGFGNLIVEYNGTKYYYHDSSENNFVVGYSKDNPDASTYISDLTYRVFFYDANGNILGGIKL